MILIISIDLDTSTDVIERWLQYYQADFIRINASSLALDLQYADPLENIFEFRNGMIIDTASINVVYLRKWFPNDHLKRYFIPPEDNNIVQAIRQENEELGSYFKRMLKHARWIDEERYMRISKVEQVMIARSCGISVPRTIITSSKERLAAFMCTIAPAKVITKPFIAHFSFQYDNNLYSSYTEVVDEVFINGLSEEFAPSLFQEYIEKKFEVRSFYLDGRFYSMIYFTQQQCATAIDSKKGNGPQGFKTEPIQLPFTLEAKLREFMQQANLVTGSFDLIYTPDGEYVFVELNPSGIFENISYLGNFQIEKIFAQTLMHYDRQFPG